MGELRLTPGMAKTLRQAREATLRNQGWVPASEASAKAFLFFCLGVLVGVLITMIVTVLT